jgi:hypothetical protein
MACYRQQLSLAVTTNMRLSTSKRRWFAVLLAVVLVGAGVIATRIALNRRAEQKRRREYEAITRAYAGALTQGMRRSEVEEYLRERHQKFGQMCCVGRRRDAWADLVKIGQEKVPWFCSEHNIYVAFVFDSVEPRSFPKATDTDTLVNVVLYPRLEASNRNDCWRNIAITQVIAVTFTHQLPRDPSVPNLWRPPQFQPSEVC